MVPLSSSPTHVSHPRRVSMHVAETAVLVDRPRTCVWSQSLLSRPHRPPATTGLSSTWPGLFPRMRITTKVSSHTASVHLPLGQLVSLTPHPQPRCLVPPTSPVWDDPLTPDPGVCQSAPTTGPTALPVNRAGRVIINPSVSSAAWDQLPGTSVTPGCPCLHSD